MPKKTDPTRRRAPGRKPPAKKKSAKGAKPLGEYHRKRDFAVTPEPAGSRARSARSELSFVDFRLELDGVMKSWAVPKGPSLDPTVKRLAVQVEDHPIEYNQFEGVIPAGEYGGGTVMLWDRGHYQPEGEPADPVGALRDGFEKGDFKFVLDGERLKGAWVLVRTRRPASRPQWLLIKHRDKFAREDFDPVEEYQTSVTTGRDMRQIASKSP